MSRSRQGGRLGKNTTTIAGAALAAPVGALSSTTTAGANPGGAATL